MLKHLMFDIARK